MSANERPKLRPYLTVSRLPAPGINGKELILYDRLRLSSAQLGLTAAELECLKLLDGTRSLRDIQYEMMSLLGGMLVPLEVFAGLIETLDEVGFLDSPRFHQQIDAPIRKPCCVGVYDADPVGFRRQMRELFVHPRASGLPGSFRNDGAVRAILAPHIDYHRGGLAYTFAFKELVESSPARLFVILGTSHYCSWKRFTLTRKDFQTPLGVIPTDQEYVDRLVSHYGEGLFDEEWVAHLPEHSIELEVVLLHYLYEGKRDIRIVPLVVGSFEDCIRGGEPPEAKRDIQRMLAALQAVEQEMREPICYIISGDLAHIGPNFGASHALRETELVHSRAQDLVLMEKVEEVDAQAYYQLIAQEKDERNICGLSPTWVTLLASRPSRGRLLRYDQYIDQRGRESVSFASVVFYR